MTSLVESQNTESQIAAHIRAILELLGEDTTRPGLVKTPDRAARALIHSTSGYGMSVADAVGDALFDIDGHSQLVTVRDIEFYSLCEHHVLPFFGHVSIGYIPDGKMIGLSKLARIVDIFARRLQVQEVLTRQIMMTVKDILQPKGVMVMCNAGHLCMKMRGVEKQDSMTVTTDMCGVFENDPDLQRRFLEAIK